MLQHVNYKLRWRWGAAWNDINPARNSCRRNQFRSGLHAGSSSKTQCKLFFCTHLFQRIPSRQPTSMPNWIWCSTRSQGSHLWHQLPPQTHQHCTPTPQHPQYYRRNSQMMIALFQNQLLVSSADPSSQEVWLMAAPPESRLPDQHKKTLLCVWIHVEDWVRTCVTSTQTNLIWKYSLAASFNITWAELKAIWDIIRLDFVLQLSKLYAHWV